MAPKQRQIRMEQRNIGPDVMEQMQTRSDEQLENERKYKSIAYSILGARAAERYDAQSARSWFQKAMVASTHPQERLQIRRMADASLALAERRADDLKVAVEKLGQEAPSSRAAVRAAHDGADRPAAQRRHRCAAFAASLLVLAIVIVLLAVGAGIVKLIALPFGRPRLAARRCCSACSSTSSCWRSSRCSAAAASAPPARGPPAAPERRAGPGPARAPVPIMDAAMAPSARTTSTPPRRATAGCSTASPTIPTCTASRPAA